jgi:hypothetical protein
MSIGHVLLRQAGLRRSQRERELVCEFHRSGNGTRVPSELCRHLRTGAEVGATTSRQPTVEFVEAPLGAHRRESRRNVPLCRVRVVHDAGCDDGKALGFREGGERVIVSAVEWIAVVIEFDDDVAGAEEEHEPIEFFGRGIHPTLDEGLTHRSLSTTGEDNPVPIRLLGEVGEVVHGSSLLGTECKLC